ncbi:glycoside hydrolase family 5 protein [Rhodococcus sp. ARC_M12]|uniref:cellulase family glycosylhydrolase n=1 Tax=unclassified Rhodococcus (in: high G+C Gram-positive bacteria) TaxID=192944 RepID=UPI001FB31326|nr:MULTISPECIES: cellulase family glycosylhydrolase [unclassified Rhodococcus (in: high G+C Gram-positive bacteria)]MCJ0978374.1 glycoside hydrolase family 5 protein [Rhodococcus sp. ARC_M12]
MSATTVLIVAAGLTFGVSSVLTSPDHLVGASRAEAAPNPPGVGISDGGGLLWASDAELDTTVQFLNAMGVTSMRIAIPWSTVEYTQNQLDWTAVDRVVNKLRAANVSMLGIIAYTPPWATSPANQPINTRPASPAAFGAFAGKVAARYKGKVADYEIWNEPNGSMFYGPQPDAAGYTALLKAAYPKIKAADSAATVVGGVLGAAEQAWGIVNPVDFTNQMYAAGAAGSFDALSYHPYQYSLKFSEGPYVDHSPARQVMDMRAAMVANGDGSKKIWATEYGVPTSAVSGDQQNAMITDFIQKWRELPYTGPIFLYTMRDKATGSNDPEDTFGLLESNWGAKPALWGVMGLLQQGIPRTAEYNRFAAAPNNSGAVLGPVFPVRDTWAQYRQDAVLYEMPNGFVAVPRAVAESIRATGFLPTTPFNGTYQDFDSPFGLRVFSTAIGGTRNIGGGIYSAWDPTLGPATSDEMPQYGGGVRVTFQYGAITWTPYVGATVTR